MIDKTYAKEGQDIFVDLLLDKGFFLDIGCGPPVFANNTYALELAGWTGLLLDNFNEYCSFNQLEVCKTCRSSPAFIVDCNSIDWTVFLRDNNVPKIIDYISLDVDNANISVINNFPFNDYEFKIMTFETDCYSDGVNRKNQAINVLSQYKQYKRMLDDGIASSNDCYSCGMTMEECENRTLEGPLVWEDWWVNTKFITVDCYRNNVYWLDFLRELKNKIKENKQEQPTCVPVILPTE